MIQSAREFTQVLNLDPESRILDVLDVDSLLVSCSPFGFLVYLDSFSMLLDVLRVDPILSGPS